jgi:hypothetical protein
MEINLKNMPMKKYKNYHYIVLTFIRIYSSEELALLAAEEA